MAMEKSIYQEIAARTGGDIYVGVVGPVRTGKSTLIKRVMEELVIPNISDPYRKERARDELPQSGSGKTIMTSEPKFVPEEAVEISPDGTSKLRVRMIDSVGYMVAGAVGATEDGAPRMVTTPWYDHEIPMTEAAELGTKKVMEDHCSIGLVVTTDGTVTDIPRGDYVEAETRAITDMKATGKPFVVVVNSREPRSEAARELCSRIQEEYQVKALCADCQTMSAQEIAELLRDLLYAFPMQELRVYLPRWMDALEYDHPVKAALYDALAARAEEISEMCQAETVLGTLTQVENVAGCRLREIDLGSGMVSCELQFPESLYYDILSGKTGFAITGEGELMELLTELSQVKRSYDKIASALEEANATGYGVVIPTRGEMKLEAPEIVRKGSAYGVKLKAGAPSIHMLRVDLDTEISPMVGDEKQSQDLVNSLSEQYQSAPDQLWESNIFGKSVYEMVNDGLTTKLRRMPDDVRVKFRGSLARVINEGATGMICIIF